MGSDKGLIIRDSDLQKMAKLISTDMKAEVNSFMCEAFEIHNIRVENNWEKQNERIEQKYDIILTSFKSEVVETISIQNEEISKIKLENIDIRREMDQLKNAMPIIGTYLNLTSKVKINLRKWAMWIAIGITILLVAFKIEIINK